MVNNFCSGNFLSSVVFKHQANNGEKIQPSKACLISTFLYCLWVKYLASAAKADRTGQHSTERLYVTLNNTFHQLIPSKKYIALHISFFFLALCSLNAQRKKELWWILLMMVIRQSKSLEIFAKRPRKYTLGPRIYFRKLLQFWILEILFFFILICSSKYTTPQWPSGLRLHDLAKLFSQVREWFKRCCCQNSLFIIIQRIS